MKNNKENKTLGALLVSIILIIVAFFIVILSLGVVFQGKFGEGTLRKDHIATNATWLANYMEENRELPEDIKISLGKFTVPINLNSAQFLSLMIKCILDIEAGMEESYEMGILISEPENPYPSIEFSDDFYKYPQTKENYLALAEIVASDLDAVGGAPDYFTYIFDAEQEGAQIRYDAAVHFYASILRFYDFFEELPSIMDIKVISSQGLVPWPLTPQYSKCLSALNLYEDSTAGDQNWYYLSGAADYETFKIAKEIVSNEQNVFKAIKAIFAAVIAKTFQLTTSKLLSHVPFDVGPASFWEAWNTNIAPDAEHEIKLHALLRVLGIPTYKNYAYYYDGGNNKKWINVDVRDIKSFGIEPDFEIICESPIWPSDEDDFIEEINSFKGYDTPSSSIAMNIRGLFVNAEDDPSKMIAVAKRGGFNTFILTAKSPHGRLFYDTKYDEREKFPDTLSNFINAAKNEKETNDNKFKIYVALNVLTDSFASTFHPEWVQQRDEEPKLTGRISPCVSEYKDFIKDVLREILAYEIDGIVLMDLDWVYWGADSKDQWGRNSACSDYEFFGEQDWHKLIITDYTRELVETIRGLDEDIFISFLSSSFGKSALGEEALEAFNRLGGQDLGAISEFVDNIILNIGGYYWLTDPILSGEYDFEALTEDISILGSGYTKPKKAISIAFNLRDEWEYTPDFYKGLYNHCLDFGFEGFSLYSMASGYGERGSAFSGSQLRKIEQIGLPRCFKDADEDGFYGLSDVLLCIGGTDCDDNDADINPKAQENCGNGVDDNCDGKKDFEDDYCKKCDGDRDGYARKTCDGNDCDDEDAKINPSAKEVCDGIDSDCDGIVPRDEVDSDEDGFMICANDCDDKDASRNPNAIEVCDGVDNNCDGSLLDGEVDEDEDGFMICTNDCDDKDSSVKPGVEEICKDNIDNNCNGLVDEDCQDDPQKVPEEIKDKSAQSECVDNDNDGFGENCNLGVDCNDQNSNISPAVNEICDNEVDDNCDGKVDCDDSRCKAEDFCVVKSNKTIDEAVVADDNLDQGGGCTIWGKPRTSMSFILLHLAFIFYLILFRQRRNKGIKNKEIKVPDTVKISNEANEVPDTIKVIRKLRLNI